MMHSNDQTISWGHEPAPSASTSLLVRISVLPRFSQKCSAWTASTKQWFWFYIERSTQLGSYVLISDKDFKCPLGLIFIDNSSYNHSSYNDGSATAKFLFSGWVSATFQAISSTYPYWLSLCNLPSNLNNLLLFCCTSPLSVHCMLYNERALLKK